MWSDCLINQIIRDTQTAMWLNENEIIFVLANKNQSLDMFVYV